MQQCIDFFKVISATCNVYGKSLRGYGVIDSKIHKKVGLGGTAKITFLMGFSQTLHNIFSERQHRFNPNSEHRM